MKIMGIEQKEGDIAPKDVKEEPPSLRLEQNRRRFFPEIPDELWNDWKWQFKNRITDIERLSRFFFNFPQKDLMELRAVTSRYPMAITPYYFCLINFDDPHDPIAKQAIPSLEEITLSKWGKEDPLAESRDSVVPGLVHRYPDRVLMVVTDVCPMLCRHCTRKREWHKGFWIRPRSEIEQMLEYIRKNPHIRDVVISGGDPLTLSNSRLEEIISKLREIPHVEIIRIGTRVPVVMPQRIDDELCDILSKYGPIWINVQFNHPNEVTSEAARACEKILRAGVPLNNQTVLLKGINDSVEIQKKLSHDLLKIRVRPYYLFHADEVEGTEHFRTSIDAGIGIIEGLRGHTSGLGVPVFVVDLPEGGGKVPVQPQYVLSRNENEVIFRNYQWRVFRVRNPKGNSEGMGQSLEVLKRFESEFKARQG